MNTIDDMQNEMYFYGYCNEFEYNYTYMCESIFVLYSYNIRTCICVIIINIHTYIQVCILYLYCTLIQVHILSEYIIITIIVQFCINRMSPISWKFIN